jgi:hypothetical protein
MIAEMVREAKNRLAKERAGQQSIIEDCSYYRCGYESKIEAIV